MMRIVVTAVFRMSAVPFLYELPPCHVIFKLFTTISKYINTVLNAARARYRKIRVVHSFLTDQKELSSQCWLAILILVFDLYESRRNCFQLLCEHTTKQPSPMTERTSLSYERRSTRKAKDMIVLIFFLSQYQPQAAKHRSRRTKVVTRVVEVR